MKTLLKLLCFFLLIQGLSSCKDNDEPSLKEKVSSTVLVYMVAQNNLQSSLEKNISDMMIGMKNAPEGTNWLVYIDSNTSDPTLYLLKQNANGNVTRETVITYSNQYSTSALTMADVINDAFSRYPAENYGLILSSHANAWFPAYRTAPQNRSFGEEIVNNLSYNMDITDMANALTQVPHLKYIVFDACLMGCVEVAYELRQVADYLIASPASILSTGFPYKNVVPNLSRMTESSLLTVINQYYAEYQYSIGTLSLVKLSQMEDVAQAMNKLMQQEAAQKYANQIIPNNKQAFDTTYPCYDFGQMIDSIGVENKTYTATVKSALNKAIPYTVYSKYAYVNDWGVFSLEIKFYSGLTSYIPPSNIYSETNYRKFYKKLDWYEASGWNYTNRFTTN